MFLEDKLLEIARKVNITDLKSIDKITLELSEILFQNLFDSVDSNETDEIIISNAKRINNTLNKVINILESEQINFLEVNGFKTLLASKGINI
jgi:hypothetical protein